MIKSEWITTEGVEMRLNRNTGTTTNELYTSSKADVITYLNNKNLTFIAKEVEEYDLGGIIDEYCITITENEYVLEVGMVGNFAFTDTYRTLWTKR